MKKKGKEKVKFSPFKDDILYIENPKDSTKNLLELIINSTRWQDTKATYKNQ
jgi:hypothetical protein